MQNKRLNMLNEFKLIKQDHRSYLQDRKKIRPDLLWFKVPASLLLGSLLILTGIFYFGEISYCFFQEETFLLLNTVFNCLPRNFWAMATLLGDATLLIPLLSIFIRNNPMAWLAILGSTIIAGLISGLSKLIFNMPRPAAILDHQSFTIIGDILSKHSLPSGHTITVFTGTMTLLILRYPSIKKSQNFALISLTMLFATIVGLSRVAVGAHWPIDIWFGAMCGWIAAFIGIAFCLSLSDQSHRTFKRHYSLFIPILLLILCLSSLAKVMAGTETMLAYIVSILCGLISTLIIFYNRLGAEAKIHRPDGFASGVFNTEILLTQASRR